VVIGHDGERGSPQGQRLDGMQRAKEDELTWTHVENQKPT